MKTFATLILFMSLGFGAGAQVDTLTNGGFERWGNASPGVSGEPTTWYSNKSGSTIAQQADPTCFQESTPAHVHSGTYSVKVQTINYLGIEKVNGVVTTGVVDAPSITKTDGYIGTKNYSDSATDDRRMPFTGRPDSLVGWYQYTSGGGSEQGKIKAILHTGDYYDPEAGSSYHADLTANKIADLTFLTPMASVAAWTRFSLPFNYVSASSPAYIMINITPSADQNTNVAGSTMWIDDLSVVYNPPTAVSTVAMAAEDVKVYSADKTVYVNFATASNKQSAITIMDVTGKKVFTQTITGNNNFNSFNLSDLNTGVYIYQLSNSDYRKTGKIFIQ